MREIVCKLVLDSVIIREVKKQICQPQRRLGVHLNYGIQVLTQTDFFLHKFSF